MVVAATMPAAPAHRTRRSLLNCSAIFKCRQTKPELILCAVRAYLRYSLSFHDVEERLNERGLKAGHATILLPTAPVPLCAGRIRPRIGKFLHDALLNVSVTVILTQYFFRNFIAIPVFHFALLFLYGGRGSLQN